MADKTTSKMLRFSYLFVHIEDLFIVGMLYFTHGSFSHTLVNSLYVVVLLFGLIYACRNGLRPVLALYGL